MDTREIFELMDKFDRSTLSEVIISQGDLRVTLRKTGASGDLRAGSPGQSDGLVESPPLSSHQSLSSEAHHPDSEQEDGEMISSPIVGTFYRSASPDSPPFVESGQSVEEGQTLCIIEAMKVMNELQAEFECEIADVLVENGTMVEFGTPLFRVKR